MVLPLLATLLMVGLTVSAALPPLAHAEGAWLDDPSVVWNAPGMAIPRPFEHTPGPKPEVDPRCAQQARPAESDEDGAVEGAGWTLFGSYTGGWGVKIVQGLAGYDGMCRPIEYQAFVFVEGKLAGTLSPMPMNSRTDGALSLASFFGPDRIVGEYVRYTEQDPLCCPSARSTANYKIERSAAGAVVVREDTTTEPTGTGQP